MGTHSEYVGQSCLASRMLVCYTEHDIHAMCNSRLAGTWTLRCILMYHAPVFALFGFVEREVLAATTHRIPP